MVHIVPSISFLKSFIKELEQGCGVVQSIRNSADTERTTFSAQVLIWSVQYQQSGDSNQWEPQTHFQSSLQQLLIIGLGGGPIYQNLLQLEQEMQEEFEIQWKGYIESLPQKLSIPILFFYFPAYIVLLFGPLITQFMEEML